MRNPLHAFLLRHRIYCELCTAPIPATRVVKIRRRPAWPETRDTCVCDAHYRANTPIETGMRERARLAK